MSKHTEWILDRLSNEQIVELAKGVSEEVLFKRLEELANEAGEIEDTQTVEGDMKMGIENASRLAYPIEAIETLSKMGEELETRISDLANELSPIFNPEHPTPEEKNPSNADPPGRSALMESIGVVECRLSDCIKYVNWIIGRLDL